MKASVVAALSLAVLAGLTAAIIRISGGSAFIYAISYIFFAAISAIAFVVRVTLSRRSVAPINGKDNWILLAPVGLLFVPLEPAWFGFAIVAICLGIGRVVWEMKRPTTLG